MAHKEDGSDEITVKKDPDLSETELDEVSGGKTQLSGPYDDRSGNTFTTSGDPTKVVR